jgi:probable HAF family extracellular repeat protein
MRRSRLTPIPVLLAVSLAVVLGPGLPASASAENGFHTGISAETAQLRTSSDVPRYRLVDLGTLGGDSSFATAMNDRGAVVGRAQTADGSYHGFLWRRGRMTDLGLLSPADVNNRGQVVGTRDDVSGAFLWSRGRLTPLAGLTFPTAVNDRGQVVGLRATDGGPDTPALWSRGAVRALPLDSVSDLNNRGQVAGGRLLGSGGFHASVWYRGRVTDLGAAAFDRSNTYRVNTKGWVIGWTFSAQQFERGALWRRGIRTDLGTLGGSLTHAVAINDRGVILVTSQVADGNVHPALWRRGILSDLAGSGVDVNGDVVDFNDRGQIAGSIRLEGGAHAVIYRPILPRT